MDEADLTVTMVDLHEKLSFQISALQQELVSISSRKTVVEFHLFHVNFLTV